MSRGAHRVRFTHLGVLFEGQIRPACRPDKPTMAMTGNVDKVDCHACKLALEDFYALMEKKKEAGEIPDDFTGVGVRKREHRMTQGPSVPASGRVYLNRRARMAANKMREKK